MDILRKYISILSILIFGNSIHSQQTTQSSHFVYNYFAFNPAVAGSQNCYNLKLGFRTQWINFEGHPRTGFGSFHTRLKFKKTRTNRTYHGVGAYIENDVLGYLGTTTINLAYAYHFPISRDVMMSAGLFAGIQQFKVDAGKIIVQNNNDPLLGGAGSRLLTPYVTPGIFLRHDDWFAGIAIRQIYRNKWSKLIGNEARNRFHYSIVGGKRIKLGDYTNLVPSAMLKYVGYSKPAIDINAMFELSKALDLGIGWRNQDALYALMKLKFARYFSLAYAFDFTYSRLRTVSSNTHEFILGISACSHDSGNTFFCPVFD